MKFPARLKKLLGPRPWKPQHHPCPLRRGETERGLVEDLRKARVSALCMGPIFTFAGPILGWLILGPRPVDQWTSTGGILTLIVCTCWTGCGIAMIVWACRWTPESWARLVLERMDRAEARAKRRAEAKRGASGSSPRDPRRTGKGARGS